MTFFSQIQARQEIETKAEGIQRALDNAPDHLKEYVLDTIVEIAQEQETLTADDVTYRMHQNGVLMPNRNAIGGLMRTASSMGWIAHTGQYKQSENPSRHGAIIGVWRSLILQS